MNKTTLKPPRELTWEDLRRRASEVGMPAWKLAEELAVHERDGELLFLDFSDN